MTKILQYSENQNIFNTDEDITSSPKDKAKSLHCAKVIFRHGDVVDTKVPAVEINDAVRTVLCNSKIKIGKYDISKNSSFYEIKVLFSISTDLLRMVLTKAVSVVALKYRCNNCVLEVDGTEKTICLHY